MEPNEMLIWLKLLTNEEIKKSLFKIMSGIRELISYVPKKRPKGLNVVKSINKED